VFHRSFSKLGVWHRPKRRLANLPWPRRPRGLTREVILDEVSPSSAAAVTCAVRSWALQPEHYVGAVARSCDKREISSRMASSRKLKAALMAQDSRAEWLPSPPNRPPRQRASGFSTSRPPRAESHLPCHADVGTVPGLGADFMVATSPAGTRGYG
jgi:hypothetical protein